MTSARSIRSELDQLKAEVEALRAQRRKAPEPPAAETGPEPGPESGQAPSLEQQLRQLLATAEDMLADAEDTVATHPVTSVAAALALGIVIGRLTAR